jgi:hypothetical protein
MSNPHQLAQEAGSLDDRQWQVFLNDLSRVRDDRSISVVGSLPKNPTRDEAAGWIARKHLAADPGVTDVWYLPGNAPEREIRLLEVNVLLAEFGEEERLPIDFGFDVDGTVFSLLVLDLTPNQWKQVREGAAPLPENWNLDGARHFGYPQP